MNSEEYEKLNKRIIDILSAIEELTSKVRIVQSDNANLRGQFNRKLLGLKKSDNLEESETEPKKESSIFLGPNGNPLS